jgi:predicted transposase/invertase (TIGR01784 family)
MTQNNSKKWIRFDWALKRLLRNKADYVVLEGFLSVLLNEKLKIVNIKESESNQEHSDDKFNRVDIMVEDSRGELIIIELQTNSQVDYFMRMLYGVSKAITEHISLGDDYYKIRKVYHINIVYFRLGDGSDYVYHGFTEFRGIHCNDLLQLTKQQKEFFACETIKDLHPEYYVLCVNNFDNAAEDSLDEWIYYLKNNDIPERFTAPGLDEARKRLLYDQLSEEERMNYNHHLVQTRYEQGIVKDAHVKGVAAGRIEGIAEGIAIGETERNQLKDDLKTAEENLKAAQAENSAAQKNTVINCLRAGLPVDVISTITGLSVDRIEKMMDE